MSQGRSSQAKQRYQRCIRECCRSTVTRAYRVNYPSHQWQSGTRNPLIYQFSSGNAVQLLRQSKSPVYNHWSIENSLHWVLDVSFNEDACQIRKDHPPQNLSLLRQIAPNLLTQEKPAKVGIKAKRKKAGWDDVCFAKVLAHA